MLLAERYAPPARRRAAPARDRGLRGAPARGRARSRSAAAGRRLPRRRGRRRDEIATVGSSAGCAAREPEAMRDLLRGSQPAGACRAVHRSPCRPSSTTLIDAWFRLALRLPVRSGRCARPSSVEPVDFGGTIRPATPDDLDAVVDVRQDPLGPCRRVAELLRARRCRRATSSVPSASDLWDEPDIVQPRSSPSVDGRVVGHADALSPARPATCGCPRRTSTSALAATLDEVRGTRRRHSRSRRTR